VQNFPLCNNGLMQYLERRMRREVEVLGEDATGCRVTHDDGAAALRPDEEGRQKILWILRRGGGS